jgi:hypothetical protein
MSVSVVNGYLCFSSCDEATARQGKDPQAQPGALGEAGKDKTSGFNHRPATVLDGLLKDLASAVNGAAAAAPTDNNGQPTLPTVDRLA